MLLFIKYNLRAVDYKLEALDTPPDNVVLPNHRDLPVSVSVDPAENNNNDHNSESEPGQDSEESD